MNDLSRERVLDRTKHALTNNLHYLTENASAAVEWIVGKAWDLAGDVALCREPMEASVDAHGAPKDKKGDLHGDQDGPGDRHGDQDGDGLDPSICDPMRRTWSPAQRIQRDRELRNSGHGDLHGDQDGPGDRHGWL